MLKKFSTILLVGLFLLFPILAKAEKVDPPNLVEVRIDDQFVDKKSVELSSDQTMNLIGTAKPESEVYLYIYDNESAEPLLAKSPVDKDGNWQYVLNQALSSGQHRIEAETHSGQDISAKVEILSFTVKEEKVISTTLYYAGGAVLLFIILIALYIYKRRT